jgi:hypothetical protein
MATMVVRRALQTAVAGWAVCQLLGCEAILGFKDITLAQGPDADLGAGGDASVDHASDESSPDAALEGERPLPSGDVDAGQVDAAILEGGPIGTCIPGGDCTPAECQTGQYACSGGSRVCNPTGHVADGTQCGTGTGHVCSGGSCGVCSAGNDCSDPGTPCVKKTIDCSSGHAACVFAMNVPDGTGCGGGNYCYGGACSACTLNVSCTPQNNPCHAGKVASCAGGTMTCTDQNVAAAAGTPCMGNDKCNQAYACISGTCTGSNPVTCTASDVCHQAGTCNPATGTCSNPTAPNGTACSGTNRCQTYSCVGGACTGSNSVTCTASDSCHVSGTCNPATGACSNPTAPDSTACGGGRMCSSGVCKCPANQIFCNGTCVDPMSDARNCGFCGNDCTITVRNVVQVTCNGGLCGFDHTCCCGAAAGSTECGCALKPVHPNTCYTGYFYSDCDGDPRNGCEIAPDAPDNSLHCSSCTDRCVSPQTCQFFDGAGVDCSAGYFCR